MTYVMSDIHGFSEPYYDFFDAVNFSDKDTLYVLGDVIDRGSDGILLLLDIMARENVTFVKGNHERMMIDIFDELCYSDKISQNAIIREEVNIAPIGQEDTLRDFCQLSRKKQYELIDYLNSLPLYQNVTVNSQKYLLVHAGLPDFDNFVDVEYYTEDELLFGEHDFSINHFDDTIIIVGHLPTRFIHGAEPDEIFKSKDSIAIDCGLGFGGKLGVLCLDTMDEFYF